MAVGASACLGMPHANDRQQVFIAQQLGLLFEAFAWPGSVAQLARELLLALAQLSSGMLFKLCAIEFGSTTSMLSINSPMALRGTRGLHLARHAPDEAASAELTGDVEVVASMIGMAEQAMVPERARLGRAMATARLSWTRLFGCAAAGDATSFLPPPASSVDAACRQ
jgi:hypothetical protein